MQFLSKQFSWFKYFLIIMGAVTIYGCGFHLRGLNLNIPETMKKLYIQNDTNDYQFVAALKPLLTSYKIDVVDNAKDATAILVISSVKTSNAMQSVTGNLSAGQYLVTYNVTYKVIDNKDHVLLPQRVSSANETYSSNATQQLAANNQVDQIKEQLSKEVANNVVNSFTQITPSDPIDDNIIIPDDSDQP
ncbi:LPS assembly lipoprotein LptE [Thiotrichales bacterium 19S3-7]|nr:LPS assembly lipoprotein LptE [Thiotrichales bacterium 19S3-7]MCF6802032.1 LPS assembly lipoprotein LptE [Thiotrichales bacterium 19S3-11]